MATRQVVMRTKYKTSVKDPGIQGVLIMMEDKFSFTPDDPTSPVKLNVRVGSIKNHKIIKERSHKLALLNLTLDPPIKGGGCIFEFGRFSERDVCRDFVSKVLTKLHTMQSSGKDLQAAPEKLFDEQLSTAEMELRMKLLRENNELQKLHQQFVVSGVLIEADYMHLPDHGILHDGSKETVEKEYDEYSRTLSQNLNQHGAVGLEGRVLDVAVGDTKTIAKALSRSKQAELTTETTEENETQVRLERVS